VGAGLGLVATPAVAATGINKTINFQGKVTNTNGTNVADGSYTFVFKLYTQQAPGGSAIWTETKSLTTTDGVFQTNLGSTTALPGSVDFNTDNIFLGMSFNGDPEMMPRIQFTAVAYAFNSDALDGLDSTQFARTDANNTLTGTQTIQNTGTGALAVQNAAGRSVLNVNTSASTVTLGNITTTSGAGLQGNLVLADGTIDGFGLTLNSATLTNNRTISFPDAGGTVCLQTATACGFEASGGTDFIRNQTTQQTANFNIISAATGSVGALIQGASGQTADILRIVDGAGITRVNVAANGVLFANGFQSTGGGTTSGAVHAISGATTSIGLSVRRIASQTADQLQIQDVGGANVLTRFDVNGYLHIDRAAAASDVVIATRVAGDTNDRLAIGADGKLSFGPGNAVSDVNLSRTAVNVLTTNQSFTASGSLSVGTASFLAKLTVAPASTSTIGTVIRGSSGQTADLIQLQNNSGDILTSFNNVGLLTLGRSAASGALQTGSAAFVDGSNTSGFADTLTVGTLTGSHSISLPDAAGTVCLQASAACGFATGTSGSYIQNQIAVAQAANFFIQSNGLATDATAVIKQASSQTGDLIDFQTSGGTLVAKVTTGGNIAVTNSLSTIDKSSASTNTNDLTVRSGNATGTTSNSGNLVLEVGTATGTAGAINIAQTTASAVNIGRSGLTTAVTGLLTVTNSTAAANIAVLKDNTTAVLTVGDAGATTFQNETNQLSALQILTTAASGAHTLFNADTINERVGIGGVATVSKFEVQGGDAAIYNNGNNPKLILGDNTSAGQNGYLQWDSANDYFRIETVGTNGLKIKDNNVAIGNIFPSQPLIVGSGSTQLFQVNTTGNITQTATGTGDAYALTDNSLTTGAALHVTSTNNTAANTSWSANLLSVTNAQGTTAVSGANLIAGLDVQFSQAPTVAGSNETVANFAIAANGGTPSDTSVGSIVNVSNNDTATGNQITAAKGININGSNVTDGLYFNGTFGTNLINSSTGNFVVTQAGAMTVASTINGQTISSAANFTGTVTVATSVIAPLHATADVASGTSANIAVKSGNGTAGGASSGSVTIQSGSANGAGSSGNVTIDAGARGATGFGGTINIGTSGAGSINLGRNGTSVANDVGVSIQGTASSTNLVLSDSTNTNELTVSFATPTATRSVSFADASGVVCLDSGNCGGSTGYILNQTGTNQTANFQITGTGRANTSILTPLLDAPTAGGTLALGTTNATAGINVNQNTTIASGKSLTIQGNTTQSNGTVSLTANGASSFTTSAGALTITSAAAANWTTAAGDLGIYAGGNLNLGNSGSATISVGSTGAHTINIGTDNASAEGVTLGSTNASSTVKQQSGVVTENHTNSGVAIATSTNSNTAFAIQNSAGNNAGLVLADTTNGNLLTNPSFETNANGWTGRGSGSIAGGDATTKLYGNASGKITTTAVSNDGAKYAFTMTNTQVYGLSFWAARTTGSDFTVRFGRADNGSTGGETNCSTGTVTTTWTRFTCTFTAGAQSGTPYVYITQNDSTARSFFIDGVQLELTTVTAYREGNVQLNGTITAPTTFKNQADTVSALDVQNASGTSQLTVDTVNGKVSLATAGILQTNNVIPTAAMTIGSSTQSLSLLGTSASSLAVTNGANTLTLNFVAPTVNGSVYQFAAPTAGSTTYTICTTDSASCGGAGGTYLRKNVANETSSFNVANNGDLLYTFTNAGGTLASGILKLDNGAATGSALQVVAAGSPGANNALISVNDTLNNATGNLLDLRSTQSATSASRLAVDTVGNVTQAGGTSTTDTINGQRISSAANFTGTVTATTSVSSPLFDTTSAGLNIGTGVATGITLGGATTTGTISIGNAAASTINIGTGAQTHTIGIGTDTTTVQGVTVGSTNTTSSVTLVGGNTGAVNLNAATVATNQATVALLNSTATTVNAFGAASTIALGSTNTTVTLGNSGGTALLRTTAGALTITSAAAATWSTGAGALTVDSAAALNLGTGTSTGVAISKTGNTTNINGTTQIGALNTAGTGAFVNNGTTKNTTLAIADQNYTGSGNTGAIGTAATTVDIYTSFTIAQATAGQTLTVPTPTVGAVASTGRVIYIANIGSTSFTLLSGGATMNVNSTATLVFNGAQWTFAGADGSSILNQNTAAQSANFWINGSGKAASFLTPTVDVITAGALGLGTATATSLNLGGTNLTGNTTFTNNSATTGVVVKSNTNSSVALVVQNASGANVLQVGTVDTNLVKNPGGEVALSSGDWPATGYTAVNAAVTRVTTTAWNGLASVQVVTTASANSGAQNNLGAGLTASTVYTLSFYAKTSSGSYDLNAVYSPDGTTGANLVSCANYNTQTIVATGWTRVTCTITTTATATNSSAFIAIRKVVGAVATFFLDGAQLEATNNVASAYGAGSLSLNAVVTSPLGLRNTENSTTAFMIQNAAATTVFNVDTLNGITTVGSQVVLGSGGNTATFGSTGEVTFAGTARHSKAIRLTAEYAGAVLDTGGASSILGTMTAGSDSTNTIAGANNMGFYKWTTGQATTQTYDVVVNVPIPDDWAAWTGSPSFYTYGTGTGAAIAVTVDDTTGTVSNINATSLTVSTSWTARTVSTFTGTYVAGNTMLVRIHMSAGTSADTRIGTITIPYLSKW
jgi:hypothetical protein